MNMSKKFMGFLLLLLIFTFSPAFADEMPEPDVFKVNGYVSVYENVVKSIMNYTQAKIDRTTKTIQISKDSFTFIKLVSLYEEAKKISSSQDKNGTEKIWVFDPKEKGSGIHFDKNKNVVIGILFE